MPTDNLEDNVIPFRTRNKEVDDLNSKIEQIRGSIERINQLMADLRRMDNGQRN